MRVIITGASGLLGRAVYKAFYGHEVIGCANSRATDGLRKVNLLDNSALESLFEEVKPHVIVHCAAERRPDIAEKNRERTEELNVQVPGRIANLCIKYNAMLIYISTDYVFDGKNPPYDVDDVPNPLNYYGQTKRAGELSVQQNLPTAVILRVPILYGNAEYPDESAVNTLVEVVKQSTPSSPIEMDNYAVRYPTHVEDIARVIKDIATKSIEEGKSIQGILHFTAEEKFTKFEMCQIFAKILGISANLRPSIPDLNNPSVVSRPHDAHLSTRKLKELGISTSHMKFEDWWTRYLTRRK
ncbi:uncharacterized protein VTP21DRAFT_426 [Calcarisporiella thermophila]|uniref:uncharacterized protein n=1 Tax=Calcarisporiella thermophila TaxID=911321 RepID=UPI0037446CB3